MPKTSVEQFVEKFTKVMNDIEQTCKFQFDEKMGYIGPIPFELNTTVLSVEIKLPKLMAEKQNPDHLISSKTEDLIKEDATKEWAEVGGFVQVKSDAFTGSNAKFNS